MLGFQPRPAYKRESSIPVLPLKVEGSNPTGFWAFLFLPILAVCVLEHVPNGRAPLLILFVISIRNGNGSWHSQV